MHISVQIKPTAAAGLREGRSVAGDDTQELLKVAKEYQVNLKPVFPIASTPEEAGDYFVHVEEPSKAEELLQKLRESSAVDNAHQVPDAELP